MACMSVTIESLRFENGFTYRSCDMPLADQGLVYLNGPNGHGKSTPFETLQHIMYGTTSRGVRKDGIACAVPDAGGFLGEVVLRNPDGRWLVRQTRNHERYKTSMQVLKWTGEKWSTRWDGGGSPKKMDDAQKLASTLLGLQQHEFSGCMYLSQAGAHTLIEGTPGEKMRYVAQLFGLDVCDRMIVWLRDTLKKAEREIDELPVLEARHDALKEDHSSYDVPRAEDLIVMRAAMQVGAERKHRLKTAIYEARDSLTAARKTDELRRERQAIGDVGDADALRARLTKLQDKRAALLQRKAEAEERAEIEEELAELPATPYSDDELVDKMESVQKEVSRLDTLLGQLDERVDLESKLLSLPESEPVAELETRLSALREERAVAVSDTKAKQQEVAVLRKAIDTCDTGTCPTCHRDLDLDQMRQMVKKAQKLADELNDWAADLTGRLATLETRVKLAREREATVAALSALPTGDTAATLDGLERAKATYRDLKATRSAAVSRAALERRLTALGDVTAEDVEAKLAKVEVLLAGVSSELERAVEAAALDRQLRDAPLVDVAVSKAFCEAAEAEQQRVEDAVSVVQERLTRATVAQDDYEALTHDLEAVVAELERLAEPRRRVHVLNYAIAAAQKLKRRKLHQVVESVRDCLPRFASTMFSHEPNTRFIVSSDDESLDLVCRRRVGEALVDIPVKSLSGGEKQRLSVALVFTLHALLHARKRPDLLILDEVDRGLDDVGIASLMSLVRSVREQYGTVIMTSHRSQIAGAAFDRVWTVRKQDEASVLITDGGSVC